MKRLRVMDSSGDTVVEFDEANAEQAAHGEAKALFERLTKSGSAVFAVNRGAGEADKRVKKFDELEAENIVVPLIVGG